MSKQGKKHGAGDGFTLLLFVVLGIYLYSLAGK